MPYDASQIRSAVLAELAGGIGFEGSTPQARLRQASRSFLFNTAAGRSLGADELAEECALVARIVLGDQGGHWYWKLIGLLSVFGSIDGIDRALAAHTNALPATGAADVLTYRLEANVCDLHFVTNLHRDALVRAVSEPGRTPGWLVRNYPESLLVLRLLDEPWLKGFLHQAGFDCLNDDIRNEKLNDHAATVYLRCMRLDDSFGAEKVRLDSIAGANHSRKRLDDESRSGIAIANALALRLVSSPTHRVPVAERFSRSANESSANAAA